jgi:hypothetical protein
MKRRRFFQALAAIPAAAPLAAQQPATAPAPGGGRGGGRGAQVPDDTKLEVSVAEGATDAMPRFFTPAEFGALRKVSDILAPANAGGPGALAAEGPEFLDFLIGRSDAARQSLYRAGLDGLNGQARKQFGKTFAELDSAQAETLMASLRAPWTYEEPSDPVARFLRAAKGDVRMATANSRAAGAGRRIAGSGLYWYPLD